MSFFTRLLSSISIPIIITMMLLLIQKLNSKELQKNLTKEHIVIRLSKVYLWIGLLGIVVLSTFCLIMFFFPNDTTTWWVWMIFIFFILLGFCLVCSTLIFKIDIYRNKDYFLYRNIFLKTRKIYYYECIHYRCTQHDVIIKTEKKKITVDRNAVNVEFLIAMLHENRVTKIR